MFEKIFNEFTSKYDFNDPNILLKYNHSYRVRNLSLKYAHILNYSEEDIRLAEFIGLYHDIGRFTQLEKYHTYDDSKSIDHADEAVRVLFEDKVIDNFDFNEEEREIIRFAIKNHNKYEIEECSDERKLMHAKLIRDTDKTDIVYLFAYLDEIPLKVEDVEVDEIIINCFKERKSLKRCKVENFDFFEYLAFTYDIYNKEFLSEFKIYVDKLFNRYNKNKSFEEAYKYIKDF